MLIGVNLFLGKVFNYGEESSKKWPTIDDVCTEGEGVKNTPDLRTNGEVYFGQRVKNYQHFVDVIYVSPLTVDANSADADDGDAFCVAAN